jgi:hypothetical protein
MSEKHIQNVKRKLSAVKTNLRSVAEDAVYDQLLQIIHRPGWTTPAEIAFFETVLNSIDAHARLLSQPHKDLLRSSQLVEAKTAAITQ